MEACLHVSCVGGATLYAARRPCEFGGGRLHACVHGVCVWGGGGRGAPHVCMTGSRIHRPSYDTGSSISRHTHTPVSEPAEGLRGFAAPLKRNQRKEEQEGDQAPGQAISPAVPEQAAGNEDVGRQVQLDGPHIPGRDRPGCNQGGEGEEQASKKSSKPTRPRQRGPLL